MPGNTRLICQQVTGKGGAGVLLAQNPPTIKKPVNEYSLTGFVFGGAGGSRTPVREAAI